jgi:Phage integrase, N-terminal SAM-like domain
MQREVQTFGTVVDEFLAPHVAAKRKGRTGSEYRRILQSRIVPAFGSKRIVDVRRNDVRNFTPSLQPRPTQGHTTIGSIYEA